MDSLLKIPKEIAAQFLKQWGEVMSTAGFKRQEIVASLLKPVISSEENNCLTNSQRISSNISLRNSNFQILLMKQLLSPSQKKSAAKRLSSANLLVFATRYTRSYLRLWLRD